MKNNLIQKTKDLKTNKQKGFVALYAVLITSLILSMVIGISSISYKELVLSSYAKYSHYAFFAADTGLECAQYFDQAGIFLKPSPTVDCDNQSLSVVPKTGSVYEFSFDLITNVSLNKKSCVKVSINKDFQYDFDEDGIIDSNTIIESIGYSKECSTVNSSTNDSSIVQRALRVNYIN